MPQPRTCPHCGQLVDNPVDNQAQTALFPQVGEKSPREYKLYQDTELVSRSPLSDSEIPPAGARSSLHASLLAVFGERWKRSYKREYPATPADRSQLGRFMKQHGNLIEGFEAMCDRYVCDRRQFLIDRSGGHTLKWLLTNGLALYGGIPRETKEQYNARLRQEHERRKRNRALRPQNPVMRDLIAGLAEKKIAGY